MDWFGLTRAQALTLVIFRVNNSLYTDQARIIAHAFIAAEETNLLPARRALNG